MRVVDYDPISSVYDTRYAAGGPTGVAECLRELVHSAGARTIVELGCGTGHWLAGLEHSAWTCGLDLAMGMLRKAQEKLPHGILVRADAHRIPFQSGSCDVVYCVNALHHFADPAIVIEQASRVLRDAGTLAVIGMDPHVGIDRWYLYDYFPGTLETDLRRYPSTEQIARWMTAAGFSRSQRRPPAKIKRRLRGEGVFDDPVLHKQGTSQLALLTDEAYLAGMNRIRSAVADNPAVVFSIDVSLHVTVGTKNERAEMYWPEPPEQVW